MATIKQGDGACWMTILSAKSKRRPNTEMTPQGTIIESTDRQNTCGMAPQGLVVMKELASRYPYDSLDTGVPTLRAVAYRKLMSNELMKMMQVRCDRVGIHVIQFDLTDLSYAPEVKTLNPLTHRRQPYHRLPLLLFKQLAASCCLLKHNRLLMVGITTPYPMRLENSSKLLCR